MGLGGVGTRHAQRDVQHKTAAAARRAVQVNAPAHHLRQLHADRQAQTTAAITARGGTVSLHKSTKNGLLFVQCNPNAGVGDFNAQSQTAYKPIGWPHRYFNLPLFGKFDGIADQIGHNLPQAPRVAHGFQRQVVAGAQIQLEAFAFGGHPQGHHHFPQPAFERKTHLLQNQFLGLQA